MRSYRTFSPLPEIRRYVFCGTFRPLRALELRGTLPCGVRTFLFLAEAIAHLPAIIYLKRSRIFCNSKGRGEWNSSSFPVVGWVNRKQAACRKYRSKLPYFLAKFR